MDTVHKPPASEIYAYPNPFHYSHQGQIIIEVPDTKGESKADFNVYTPAMELVYSGTLPFIGNTLTWEVGSSKACFGCLHLCC